MNSLKSWMTVLLIATLVLMISGCSKDEKNPTAQENPVAADSMVQLANAQLEQELFDLANGPDVESPGDVDLSAAYDLYVQALSHQASHPGANFGAGMLELIMLSRDTEVQNFFDRLKAFSDSSHYFDVGQGGSFLGGAPHMTSPVLRLDQVSMPVASPLKLLRGMTRTLDDNGPTVNELQNLCVTRILPRVRTAEQRLSTVATNRDFAFIITPRMQGDDREDPLQIDLTEVQFTLAVLSGLEAFLNHFCAYDLNLPAYDGPAMLAALSPGSSFARLKTDGAARMAAARDSWQNAVTRLDSAVSFLENETGNQANHVIHIDPYDDLTQADLDSIKANLPRIRNLLTTSETFQFDMDGDESTPPEDVTISLSNFFGTPIHDLKALFPAYTVTLDTQMTDGDNLYDWRAVPAQSIFIGADAYYSWYRSASYSEGILQYQWADTDFTAPAWNQAFDEKVAELVNLPYCSVYIYYSGYLTVGDHDLNADLSWNYPAPTRYRYVPRITWQAENFSEWVLPDPTFGGLFPGMTDARFKQMYNITADGWERTSTWYLW